MEVLGVLLTALPIFFFFLTVLIFFYSLFKILGYDEHSESSSIFGKRLESSSVPTNGHCKRFSKNNVTAGNLFVLRERFRVSFLYVYKFYFMIVFGSFYYLRQFPKKPKPGLDVGW